MGCEERRVCILGARPAGASQSGSQPTDHPPGEGAEPASFRWVLMLELRTEPDSVRPGLDIRAASEDVPNRLEEEAESASAEEDRLASPRLIAEPLPEDGVVLFEHHRGTGEVSKRVLTMPGNGNCLSKDWTMLRLLLEQLEKDRAADVPMAHRGWVSYDRLVKARTSDAKARATRKKMNPLTTAFSRLRSECEDEFGKGAGPLLRVSKCDQGRRAVRLEGRVLDDELTLEVLEPAPASSEE